MQTYRLAAEIDLDILRCRSTGAFGVLVEPHRILAGWAVWNPGVAPGWAV